MKNFAIIIAFIFTGNTIGAQQFAFYRGIDSNEIRIQVETLRNQFGKNKSYLAADELKILTALSFYPELEEVTIEFITGKISSSLRAQPDYGSILKRRKNRKYQIIVNEDTSLAIHPSKSSFSSQVGFYAHELAHIVNYETKTNLELIGYGVKYLCDGQFKCSLERGADKTVVAHGAGYLKFEASKFIFYDAGAPAQYVAYKRKNYFSPEDILEMSEKQEVEYFTMGEALGNHGYARK